jgi:NTP pyrophosphatase (non-canonical NTP hydrolase)
MDDQTTLSDLRALALRFRDERNWAQFHDPKNLAAGLAIEAAELQELFLWKKPEEIAAILASEPGARRAREEIADILIFILYLSHACGVDLAEATRAKLEANAAKYPVEKCFGRHAKYDEL